MKKTIWTQSYDINTLLVNPGKQLGLFGLLNLIQDTAWLHATHLGYGYEEMIRDQTGWALTRQKLWMKRWPRWRESIDIRTWLRPADGIKVIRDFEIIHNHEVIGMCSTQWILIDLRTRKAADKDFHLAAGDCREDAPEFISASKISLQKDLHELMQLHVRNSDLDMNGHVNNTRYAQWVLDAVPGDPSLEYSLNEYEVNFIAETKSGDVISIMGGTTAEQCFKFHGVRSSDKKIVFAATMKVIA